MEKCWPQFAKNCELFLLILFDYLNLEWANVRVSVTRKYTNKAGITHIFTTKHLNLRYHYASGTLSIRRKFSSRSSKHNPNASFQKSLKRSENLQQFLSLWPGPDQQELWLAGPGTDSCSLISLQPRRHGERRLAPAAPSLHSLRKSRSHNHHVHHKAVCWSCHWKLS